MPWFACEYCAVYDGSYSKGKQFLMTEYATMFFGEKAYEMESDSQLRETLAIGLSAKSIHGPNWDQFPFLVPMKYTIEELYVKATDRAWRAWGITGWHYFNFVAGYGDPPEAKGRFLAYLNRYKVMTKPVVVRPDWANPQFDMYSSYMQPLLAYIGGSPAFTDKTHGYFSGETVNKQIVVVWGRARNQGDHGGMAPRREAGRNGAQEPERRGRRVPPR